MTVEVSGAIDLSINTADYYDERYAKYKIVSIFDPALFPDGTESLPDEVEYEITLGDDMNKITCGDLIGVEKSWTKKNNDHWEYKLSKVVTNKPPIADAGSNQVVDVGDTVGTEIRIYVDGVEDTKIHTSCSQPIGPGLISGDFTVIEGYSKDGGLLCPL